jgi:hypothetical protein
MTTLKNLLNRLPAARRKKIDKRAKELITQEKLRNLRKAKSNTR